MPLHAIFYSDIVSTFPKWFHKDVNSVHKHILEVQM